MSSCQSVTRLPCKQLYVIRTPLSPFSQYCFVFLLHQAISFNIQFLAILWSERFYPLFKKKKKNPPELCLPLVDSKMTRSGSYSQPWSGKDVSQTTKLCSLRGTGKVVPEGKSECFYKEKRHWEGRNNSYLL